MYPCQNFRGPICQSSYSHFDVQLEMNYAKVLGKKEMPLPQE